MFSFHKPRVYRSTEGCCICRAKSSSSRFTDSKKYEDDSMKCFNLEKARQGEICNACVLLVKRFKRLPVGSNRHWGHVVDARIGPGMKSISKFKKLKEECLQQQQRQQSSSTETNKILSGKISSIPEKFCKIFRKNKKKNNLENSKFKEKREDNSWDDNSSPATPESLNSEEEMNFQNRNRRRRLSGIKRRKNMKPMKLSKRTLDSVGFFDENIWHCIASCCGIVFENRKIGALMIDYEQCKPCADHVDFFKSKVIKSSPAQSIEMEVDNKTESTISYGNGNSIIARQKLLSNSIINVSASIGHADILPMAIDANSITMKNHQALKKHQLFYKRQSENFPHNENVITSQNMISPYKTEPIANSSAFHQNGQDMKITPTPKNNKHSFLHKIKSDTGKMVKHQIEKLSGGARIKTAEANDIKNIVKISDQMKAVIISSSETMPTNTKPSADGVTTKFSDNSSDSGFDENLPDHKPAAQLVHDGKERKILIRPIESLFLASSIPVTMPGPPGSHKTIQTTRQIHTPMPHNMALLNNHKVRAIYNSGADGGLTNISMTPSSVSSSATAVATTLLNVSTTSSTMGSNLNHKKFLYVKGKQNIERPPNN